MARTTTNTKKRFNELLEFFGIREGNVGGNVLDGIREPQSLPHVNQPIVTHVPPASSSVNVLGGSRRPEVARSDHYGDFGTTPPGGIPPVRPSVNQIREVVRPNLFVPTVYQDCKMICEALRRGQTVILNLGDLEGMDKLKLSSFVFGFIFSIDGKVSQISSGILLCEPTRHTNTPPEAIEAFRRTNFR